MNRNVLTARELRTYQQQLLDLEARLTGRVARLEAEALRPAVNAQLDPREEPPAHEADPATRSAEDEVAIAVLGSEEQVLADVRAALARIEAKTFGACEKCGRAIARGRLDTIPYAAHCARCATELEAQSDTVRTGSS